MKKIGSKKIAKNLLRALKVNNFIIKKKTLWIKNIFLIAEKGIDLKIDIKQPQLYFDQSEELKK